MNGLVVRMMDKSEELLESAVLTLVTGMLILPYVVLGTLPIPDGLKMIVIIVTAFPFMVVYMSVMFKLMGWSDRKEIEE